MKKLYLVLAAIVLVLATVAAYFYWFAPSTLDLIDSTTVADDAKLDKQVVADIGLDTKLPVVLTSKSGNFYRFVIGDWKADGFSVLALKEEGKKFEVVFIGREFAPCDTVRKYGIPSALAPSCVESVVVDQTNAVRAFISRYAH